MGRTCSRNVKQIGLISCKVLVGKPEGWKPHGRPRRRLEDNVKIDVQQHAETESRCRVINTPASYSGGPDFKSRPETGYPEVLHGSLQSLQANCGIVP
jgi:hypothetical protein